MSPRRHIISSVLLRSTSICSQMSRRVRTVSCVKFLRLTQAKFMLISRAAKSLFKIKVRMWYNQLRPNISVKYGKFEVITKSHQSINLNFSVFSRFIKSSLLCFLWILKAFLSLPGRYAPLERQSRASSGINYICSVKIGWIEVRRHGSIFSQLCNNSKNAFSKYLSQMN